MPAILLPLAMGMAGGILSQALPLGALSEAMGGFWNSLFHNTRLEPTTLIQLRLFGLMDDETFYDQMAKSGYSAERSDLAVLVNAQWMDPASIIRSGWRNGDNDADIIQSLVEHGWIEKEAQGFLNANKYYPNPADLVNWQAKEVFEPAMVQKYGLDAELGGVERDAFYRAGMDDEQIQNFWRAHWQHPAWTQTTEMMHRDQLTEEDLWSWFRLMEVPPYWRDKMIATSYKPFTRVDVRRMHKLGTIDDKDLKRAYQDLGYDEEKAQAMVDFTIDYNQQVGESPDLDLTRSMLEKAYRIGLLSPSEFDTYLQDMGYSEPNAAFIHSILDQDISLDRAQDWISILRNQVGAGLITVQEAEIEMTSLGLSDDAVRHWGVIFANYVEQPMKAPSKTDIKAWFVAKTIEPPKAREYLKNIGYRDEEIYLYLKSWGGAEQRYEDWVQFMRDTAA